MDDSLSALKNYPINSSSAASVGGPDESWTIEEVLHWSLSQYHNAAMRRTEIYTSALRNQCEDECEDVMTLHEAAVSMKERGQMNDREEESVVAVGTAGGENADPQRAQQGDHPLHPHVAKQPVDAAASCSTVSATAAAATQGIEPLQQASPSTTATTLRITITSGPHQHQTFHLQPKHTQPCLIGRSKGKKFLRNGISLNKDQEVSTTHGKVTVEEQQVEEDSNEEQVEEEVFKKKFYYTDVGSTNGTTTVTDNMRLEPNVRVEIPEDEGGLELRLGNSILKIVVIG